MDKAKRRTSGLLVEQVGDETLVFDTEANVAHTLDPDASAIWAALRETHSVSEVTTRSRLSEAQVLTTIERLVAIDLVEAPGVSRREALSRLAVAGAAAVGMPAIVSLAIPEAANAQSGLSSTSLRG